MDNKHLEAAAKAIIRQRASEGDHLGPPLAGAALDSFVNKSWRLWLGEAETAVTAYLRSVLEAKEPATFEGEGKYKSQWDAFDDGFTQGYTICAASLSEAQERMKEARRRIGFMTNAQIAKAARILGGEAYSPMSRECQECQGTGLTEGEEEDGTFVQIDCPFCLPQALPAQPPLEDAPDADPHSA